MLRQTSGVSHGTIQYHGFKNHQETRWVVHGYTVPCYASYDIESTAWKYQDNVINPTINDPQYDHERVV